MGNNRDKIRIERKVTLTPSPSWVLEVVRVVPTGERAGYVSAEVAASASQLAAKTLADVLTEAGYEVELS